MLLVIPATACSLQASTAEDGTPAPPLVDCRPHAAYPDLDALADDFAQAPSLSGLVGGDIAADVRLARGDRLFAFGDSLIDTEISPASLVRNSLLLLRDAHACLVLGPEGSAFVPDRADGVGYWPMSLLEVSPEGRVVVFLQRVRDTYSTDDSFETLGPALAEVALDSVGMPHVVRVSDIGVDNPSRERITWGAASWRGDDGYAYVYGTANPDHEVAFGWSLHVARVPAEQVFDPTSWEYWAGTEWSPDAGSAVHLIPAVRGVSQTLSVFTADGMWHAVSKRDDYLGDDVVVWTAPAPTGAFDSGVTVARRPSDLDAGMLAYAALAHPTLFPEEGTMVVSVSRNSTDPTALDEDPTLYRPEFFRVELP